MPPRPEGGGESENGRVGGIVAIPPCVWGGATLTFTSRLVAAVSQVL